MKLLLTLSYMGTDFHGYQVQKNGRTVQGELNRAAKALFGIDCDITGCSRTDTGVHANMFCATVAKQGSSHIETEIPLSRLPLAFNAHLPVDIAVTEAKWVAEKFHPRYDVIYKEYIYRICNTASRSPFEEGRAWQIPQKIFTEAAMAEINRACAAFVGTHDFSTFMASGSTVESTVRTVKYAKVIKEGDLITFRVAADGFLYNMVRIMTGTLVSIAQGKICAAEVGEIINSCDRSRAGMTAPPHGLYLNHVHYE